jgi:hypothetical protein
LLVAQPSQVNTHAADISVPGKPRFAGFSASTSARSAKYLRASINFSSKLFDLTVKARIGRLCSAT